MSTALQAVSISGHEQRSSPKSHIVYRIDVRASVRSWQVWRRYSEFVDLDSELTKSTGAAPPAKLPPKHFSFWRTGSDDSTIQERKQGLELYLRAIVASKDERWRETFGFKDFLAVPVGKQTAVDGSPSQFTSSSWLDEQMDLQSLVRDIRADINKRDAFIDRGDVAASHSSSVQAKKKLAGLIARVGVLAKGVEGLGQAGMSEGEVQRRTDMVARLQDDCEKLSNMVIAAKRLTRPAAPASSAAPHDGSPKRAALLGPPRKAPTGSRPVTRVFGAQPTPQETDTTRPLDNHGLLQLQQLQIDQQDTQLTQLSSILQRQKHLGIAISNEIAEQIEILDEFSNEVDNVSNKLGAAKKQMNQLG